MAQKKAASAAFFLPLFPGRFAEGYRRNRVRHGRISFPTNCGIHLILRIDGALEPPRTGSRRVAEMTSVKPEQEPNPTAFQYRPPPYAAWPAARCIRQNGKCWRPV